ncbi:MAG: DNA-processing protein DprA [Solirubrobacteraceae bacterium]|jgi:DNA processing protein
MSGVTPEARACPRCLGRSWLLARLAGHLETVRGRIEPLLALEEVELIDALAGRVGDQVRRERSQFDPGAALAACAAAGLEAICGCDPGYPTPLRALAAAPAVLHVGGGLDRLGALAGERPVAIVGARRASPYGLEVARSLARGVAAAGLTVVSGMAAGIDSAAHEGALDARGATVAVLAAAPERPYPAGARALHRRIRAGGAVVSELGPGVPVRRWMFPARNRIIAALSAMTVVVAAREGSGALLTARVAADLGRTVGAVPGQVTAPLARGPHQLLRGGARLVAGPEDVLDALYGGDLGLRGPDASGARGSGAAGAAGGLGGPGRPGAPGGAAPGLGGPGPPGPPGGLTRPVLEPGLQRLLDAVADGHDELAAFAAAGLDPDRGLAALASLELAGRVRRLPGGRYAALP